MVRPMMAAITALMMAGCSLTTRDVDSYKLEAISGLQEVSDGFDSIYRIQTGWLKLDDLPDGFSMDTGDSIVAAAERCERAARPNQLPSAAPEEMKAFHLKALDVIGRVRAACQASITVVRGNDARAFFAIDLASLSADLASLREDVGR